MNDSDRISKPTTVAYDTTIARTEAPASTRPIDLVRWGPIIAGLFAAIATLATLAVLGVAIGLGQYNPGDNLAGFGLGAGIWGAVSALIAFFVGGWIAARTAAATGQSNGILNGAMVWFVAIPLLFYLLGSGIGSLVGATIGTSTQLAGQLAGNPNVQATVQAGGTQVIGGAQSTVQAVATSVTPQDVKAATTTGSNTAWGTLLSLWLAAAASILGGFLGARPNPMAQFTRRETVTHR